MGDARSCERPEVVETKGGLPMANIIRRTQTPAATHEGHEWDPVRLMRDLLRWDPFREMAPFFPGEERTFSPQFEIRETKDGYVFQADLPGVAEKDLEISVVGNR